MNRISLIHQAGALRSYFPDSEIKRAGEQYISWTGVVKPSPLSEVYTLRLEYRLGKSADVYVIAPRPLQLAPGKTKLPHVYDTAKQRLCLYYPKGNEWNPGMFYVRTLIPWACEWLRHYEVWVATGDWRGGGIEHQELDEKDTINDVK